MGIIWRFAMPLLSTLAALVIIVNSAEEDMENEYRRGMRPRVLDAGTPRHDQPWRTMEAQEIVHEHQTTQTPHWDDNSPEEYPKRRRPGRKRRRRPQPSPTEDLVPQERYTYPEEPVRPLFDEDYGRNRQTTEIGRRRRKNPIMATNQWTDEPLEADRPLRRRGLRKKRPSLDTWPQLSEFSGYRQDYPEPDIETQTSNEQIEPINSNKQFSGHFSHQETINDDDMEQEIRTTTDFIPPESYDPIDDGEIEFNGRHMKEDKSLSEFSFELMNPSEDDSKMDDDKFKLSDKSNEKLTSVLNSVEKSQEKYYEIQHGELCNLNDYIDSETELDMLKSTVQDLKAREKVYNLEVTKLLEDRKLSLSIIKSNEKIRRYRFVLQDPQFTDLIVDGEPIDPVTLKEILKRSNGTSLSEILQKHNLTLADLLHGKGNALKVLKSKDTFKTKPQVTFETKDDRDVNTGTGETVNEEKVPIDLETKYVTEPITESSVTTEDNRENQTITNINDDVKPYIVLETPISRLTLNNSLPRIVTKRRFPGGIRRKQRLRPLMNNTSKEQMTRDLMALNARKYMYHNRRNATRYREWKDMITTMKTINTTEDLNRIEENGTSTTVSISAETTTLSEFDIGDDKKNISVLELDSHKNRQSENISDIDNINMDVTEMSIETTKYMENGIKITEKSAETSIARPVNTSTLRRQAFNNRLKKKRLKQKNSTTEPPQDDLLRNLYGMGNLVSSSEFIERIQTPKSVPEDYIQSETTLEDFFITTETPNKFENRSRTTRPFVRFSTTSEHPEFITTEETAKIEIEEILNDTKTSAKLNQILMDRNMTISELVQHRERGSSHVHLADIFHNASKEPNPPEPFLSKSLIEPISREIYPLRALLDANSHDPTGKPTTVDPNFANIPVVMDFGNNVNENAENMGIMSLFNNFTRSEDNTNNNSFKQDSDGTTYKISITTVNVTHSNDNNETLTKGHVLEEGNDDIVSWNEIFTLMRKNHRNETEERAQTTTEKPIRKSKKISLEDDIDGDGLIVLEDLQHLKDFDNNIASASDEKLEVNSYDKTNSPQSTQMPGILEKIPSKTKSVTVATASIAGLAMVLFLLTYAAFKWKQQQTRNRKKRSFCDERIPTPVFENRKGHKNNSSTRSISPMLSTSNIYTLNTLDSHNGKESPDYMWDSLRKPFQ